MNIGGNGTMGITVFARVRITTGTSANFSFIASKDQAVLTIAQFAATTTYSDVFSVLPKDFVHRDRLIKICNTSTTEVLQIAEFGWLQGMFYDAPPVAVGSTSADICPLTVLLWVG